MNDLPFVDVGFVPSLYKLSDTELNALVDKYSVELKDMCDNERMYNIYMAVFLNGKISDLKMNNTFASIERKMKNSLNAT